MKDDTQTLPVKLALVAAALTGVAVRYTEHHVRALGDAQLTAKYDVYREPTTQSTRRPLFMRPEKWEEIKAARMPARIPAE